MTTCSDCYWFEQCGRLTNVLCPDHTPIEGDEPSAAEAYLETVRADITAYAMTIPDDDDVGSVFYKSRNSAQYLFI